MQQDKSSISVGKVDDSKFIAINSYQKAAGLFFHAMILLVENPLVVACSDSLNQKSELISEKHWVAKANRNIARGNK
jgi:hypothetical protein